jgi:hypothetical protein
MADKDIPITRHIKRECCWVCRRPFGHQLLHEDHHVIPCAYGGVDGPQVRICSDHHTGLHTIALRLYSGKPYFELLSPDDTYSNERLLYLASVAYNARLAVENDPNKKRVLVLSLKGDTWDKLTQLKTVYGKMGRERLVEVAVQQLFNKHFR